MNDASEPARPPLIGITSYQVNASWGTWSGVPVDLEPSAYAASVVAAGGVPVIVPPLATEEAARTVVAALDGLIVGGGEDVNPARYGEAPDPHVSVWSDARDHSELLLLDAAAESELPVLGICRGMQVMAVHAGGVLIQHLPDAVGHGRHAGGDNAYSDTAVAVEPGCRLAALVPPAFTVASHHHQAVRTAPGYEITATDADGIAQAMERPGERFEVAVQWHPEQRVDEGLFAGLVRAAAQH